MAAIYIQDGNTINNPSGDYIKIQRYQSIELKRDSSGVPTINNKVLNVKCDFTHESQSLSFFKNLALQLFLLYHSPQRINFDNTDNPVLITNPSDGEALSDGYFPGTNSEPRITFLHNESNYLKFVHELIHACIAQHPDGTYGIHSDEYLPYDSCVRQNTLCDTLVVFNGFAPGFLLDINTTIRVNFNSERQFENCNSDIIFPMNHIYNDNILKKCRKMLKSTNPSDKKRKKEKKGIPSKNLGIRGLISYENFQSYKTFFREKFEKEYDFFETVKDFKDIERDVYVNSNINNLELKLKLKLKK